MFGARSVRRSLEYLSSALHNICSLGALGAFGNLKLDRVTFLQALVTLGGNRAVVHKNIWTIGPADEAIALGIIEPLHCAFQSFHIPPFCTPLHRGAAKTRPIKMHFRAIR